MCFQHGRGCERAELTCETITNRIINFGILVLGLPDYVDKLYSLHYGAVVAMAPREDQGCNSQSTLEIKIEYDSMTNINTRTWSAIKVC